MTEGANALGRADALSAVGRHREARDLLREALAADPSNAYLLVALADAEIGCENRRAAVEAVERALAASPEDPAIILAAARVYRSAGNKKKALTFGRAAVALNPNDAYAWYVLTNIELDHRNFAQAQEAADKVRETVPASWLGDFADGLVALKQSNFVRASEDFRSVLAQNPENPNALHNLGLAMQGLGDFDQALNLIERAGRLNVSEDLHREVLASSARASLHGVNDFVDDGRPMTSSKWWWGAFIGVNILRATGARGDTVGFALAALGIGFAVWLVVLRMRQRQLSAPAQMAIEVERRDFWRRLPKPWVWNRNVIRRLITLGLVPLCVGLSVFAFSSPESKLEEDAIPGVSFDGLGENTIDDVVPNPFGKDATPRDYACQLIPVAPLFEDPGFNHQWSYEDLGCVGDALVDRQVFCDLATIGKLYNADGTPVSAESACVMPDKFGDSNP